MHLQLTRSACVQHDDGTLLPLAARDAALLAWLALEGPTPRNRLARLLWPHSTDEAARNSLRQRLFQLRRQFGAELVTGQATLALADGVPHDLAVTSPVLEGDDPIVGGEFDTWLAQHRERNRIHARQALNARADAAQQTADWPQALLAANELLVLEPLSEAAHRRLIQTHYLAGDRAAAIQAYERCERLLRSELAVAPSAQTRDLRDTLLQATATALPLTARAVPAVVLRPPRLIGRDAEARALEQGWRAGQVVAVTGEAGMGKTRLLQDFAQPRPAVVHVSARPGDAGVPFATLARLLRAVSSRQTAGQDGNAPDALAVLEPGGLPALLNTTNTPAVSGAAQRLLLQREVAARLRQQGAVQGLLVDDLHFADAASLELLQALLDDADSPLFWALAWRSAEAGTPLQALHDALAEQARLHWVALRPLDEAALAELVDSLALPGLHGAVLAPALRRRTGGNPLFVLETLKLAWIEQRPAESGRVGEGGGLALLPKPSSVTRLIERRLAQLSPTAMALARCAAVAGTEFSTALAARVLGASPLSLADAWQELEAAQVLHEEAFVHDLLYEATLASVPAPIARALHGDIAAQLQAEGRVPAATLARHWLAAGQPGHAKPQLERAAAAATQALDAREAGRLWLQLALVHEAAGAQDQAFEAAGRAVNALRELSTGPDVAGAIDRLASLARTPGQQADVHRRRAELSLTRGDLALAARAVQDALDVLGPDGPPTDRSDLLNLQGVLLRRSGRLHEARQALEAALVLARAHARPGDDYAGVLNNLGLVLQAQDDHLGAIGLMQESAERQGDPGTRARVLNNLAISLEERGQVALAHQQRLAAARAVAGSASVAERVLAISLGAVTRTLCHFREAMQHFEHARALGVDQKHFRQEDLLRQIAAMWIDLGRINLAQETLAEAGRLELQPVDQALVDMVRARCLQAQGPAQHAAVLALLAPPEAWLGASGDRRSLRRLWLLKAQALPPQDALALLQGQLAEPSVMANPGAALPLQVRLAQAWQALGAKVQARRAAERAVDWMAAVQPMEITPAEVWLTLARSAHADGDAPAAQMACARGLDFVSDIAQQHLDPLYRDGWTQRNPVNAELAALAARLR